MLNTKITVSSVPGVLKSNPYQHLLYSHLRPLGIDHRDEVFTLRNLFACRHTVDIVHFHWLFATVKTPPRLARFAVKLLLARILGYRIVWTVHNVKPHENEGFCAAIGERLLAMLCHAVVVHSVHTMNEVKAVSGVRCEVTVIPHPSYLGCYPESMSREESRVKLQIGNETFVYLWFGLVRRYKGLVNLVESFERLEGDVLLLIAGKENDERLGSFLRQKAANDPRIRLHLRYIPDDEVQLYFNAADVVVLPFSRITTSGSVMLALSFGKPVISVAQGALPEDVNGQTGILIGNDSELVDAMRTIRNMDLKTMGRNAREHAAARDWNAAALQHANLYTRIVGHCGRNKSVHEDTDIGLTSYLPPHSP